MSQVCVGIGKTVVQFERFLESRRCRREVSLVIERPPKVIVQDRRCRIPVQGKLENPGRLGRFSIPQKSQAFCVQGLVS